MLVSQARFAAMKNVSRAAVSQWKREGRLTIVGRLVDFEATEKRLLETSSYRSKRVKPAQQTDKLSVKTSDSLTMESHTVTRGAAGPWADHVPLSVMDGLPLEAVHAANSVFCGANNMAVILLRRGLDHGLIREAVCSWVEVEKRAAIECIEDDLDPPHGHDSWADSEIFTTVWADPDPAWGATWDDLIAEAAAPQRPGRA